MSAEMSKRSARIPSSNRSFIFLLSSILVVSFLIAVVLVFVPNAQAWFNSQKSWELTTQFFFVAVLGGGIALIYRYMETLRSEKRQSEEKEGERQSIQRQSLQEFYRSLVENHHSCKRVRRIVRASSAKQEDGLYMEHGKFERLMETLEDVQLGAEGSCREVQARASLFGNHKEELYKNLKSCEGYIRKLLSQYEDNYSERHSKPEEALIALSKDIRAFVGHRKGHEDTISFTSYFKPAERARDILLELIEENTPKAR
jgi:hypothetical protein